MRMSLASLAGFAISRLKSTGRTGIARAVPWALDWPVPASVSVQMALSALAVSARVSVAYRAIGAALTVRMHRHRIPPARGNNIWCRWIPRITAKITWNRLGFGVRLRFPPKVFHRQGKWHHNRGKHRHRNQYRRRYRHNHCQRQKYRQPRQGNLIHNHEYQQAAMAGDSNRSRTMRQEHEIH